MKNIEKDTLSRKQEAYLNVFGNAEDLRQGILDSIIYEKKSNHLELILPYYFSGGKEKLVLTVMEIDGTIYFHDNGRTMAELCKKTKDSYVLNEVAQYFSKMCLGHGLKDGIVLYGYMGEMSDFCRYIQTVSIIANADLYPRIDEDYYEYHRDYEQRHGEETIDFSGGSYPEKFIEMFENAIWVNYDEYLGMIAGMKFYFWGQGCSMRFRFLVNDDYSITVTDHGDFDGGRIYECMLWHNDDIRMYDKEVQEICERLGATFHDKKVTLTFDNSDGLAVTRAMFSFMQVASILSEIGHYVKL